MKKRTIIIILLLLLGASIVSLYATFALNEENTKLDPSKADYNLIYSLKSASNKQIILAPKEEKYINITLTNPYTSTVKYGMYYYLIEPSNAPDSFTITLSEDSQDLLENTIKPNQTRNISLKLNNAGDSQIELIVGALVGFEKGNIEELVQKGEVLIK